jgi:hypothetical protein
MIKKERNGQGGGGVQLGVSRGNGSRGVRRRDCGEGGAPAGDQDPAAAGASGVAAPSVRQGRGKR